MAVDIGNYNFFNFMWHNITESGVLYKYNKPKG